MQPNRPSDMANLGKFLVSYLSWRFPLLARMCRDRGFAALVVVFSITAFLSQPLTVSWILLRSRLGLAFLALGLLALVGLPRPPAPSLHFFFYPVLFLSLVLPLLMAVAFLTLAERKIMAAVQRRKGPNVVGFLGLMQPLVDGLKLVLKELVNPSVSTASLFYLSPALTFLLSIGVWAVVPFSPTSSLSDPALGLLVIFSISSLNVYGIVLAGWSSNSRYAFLGGLRSAAQMVSYEVSLGVTLLSLPLCVGSLSLFSIVEFQRHIWFIFPFFPLFLVFFVTSLAETNRPPFDLPEAESELVSGYNVEYSARGFALFFIAEYSNIILMSTLTSLLFLGGWHFPFLSVSPTLVLCAKVLLVLFCFVWVRTAFPRYRYDQLMRLGWRIFLPFVFIFLVLASSYFWFFGILPLLNSSR